MTREDALKLINDWTSNQNLVKHMLAVEAEMRAIYKVVSSKQQVARDESITKLKEEDWAVLGLVHDADYEKWPDEHPRKTIEELEKRGEPEWLIHAIRAHAWKFNRMEVEPANLMEWAIYTCDELSGFIIAVTLVRPNPPSPEASEGSKRPSRLESLKVEDVLKKWKEKSFAKGVHREQIELCEEKLGIKLPDYISICLSALQGISSELGL